MTQPVQEPSEPRMISGLGWGQRQLYRRPAPPSGDLEIKYIVCKATDVAQTFTAGGNNIIWQCNVEPNPECFTPILFAGSDYWQIRILEDGLYTVSVDIQWDTVSGSPRDIIQSLWTVDAGTAGTHFFRNFFMKAFSGSACGYEWTFRMDGTGGSNRFIEFQLSTPATLVSQVDGVYIELRKWPGSITMTGRDRDSCP